MTCLSVDVAEGILQARIGRAFLVEDRTGSRVTVMAVEPGLFEIPAIELTARTEHGWLGPVGHLSEGAAWALEYLRPPFLFRELDAVAFSLVAAGRVA